MKVTKLYLAAPYSWRDQLREHAKVLRANGFIVTASWLQERQAPDSDLNDGTLQGLKLHAKNDVRDIQEADGLILFTIPPTSAMKRGGRHVEFGIAYALGKQVILCGPRENIFHYLKEVAQFDTFPEVLQHLVDQKNAEETLPS